MLTLVKFIAPFTKALLISVRYSLYDANVNNQRLKC